MFTSGPTFRKAERWDQMKVQRIKGLAAAWHQPIEPVIQSQHTQDSKVYVAYKRVHNVKMAANTLLSNEGHANVSCDQY